MIKQNARQRDTTLYKIERDKKRMIKKNAINKRLKSI